MREGGGGQVNMFYEAVGCIVSAEQNAAKRDEIIQELFRLPNARWLEIIGLAMQDPTQLHNHDTMRRRPPLPAPLPPLKPCTPPCTLAVVPSMSPSLRRGLCRRLLLPVSVQRLLSPSGRRCNGGGGGRR